MKWLRTLGAVFVLIGGVSAGIFFVLKSALIIALGIRAAKFFATASGFAIGFGGVSVLLSFVPQIKYRIRQGQENKLLQAEISSDKERTTDYETDSLNPEKVRVRLEQLREHNPHLFDLMTKCLEQKDAIDKFQTQLDRLIKANRALYLNDIPAVLDGAEERMCANFRDIINCCLLVEDNGKMISERNQEIVKGAIESNDDELGSVEILLDRSVAYINDYNRKGISDRRELDAWIKTMEDKINEKGGLKF